MFSTDCGTHTIDSLVLVAALNLSKGLIKLNYIAEEVTVTWLESQRVVTPAMGLWVEWSRCFEDT